MEEQVHPEQIAKSKSKYEQIIWNDVDNKVKKCIKF